MLEAHSQLATVPLPGYQERSRARRALDPVMMGGLDLSSLITALHHQHPTTMSATLVMHKFATTVYCCAVACIGITVGCFAVLVITSEGPLIFAGIAIGGVVGVIVGVESLEGNQTDGRRFVAGPQNAALQ